MDQGGGKRPGAFAAYVEPWHADIFDVLDLKKNHGKEERRARDLFYGLWVPDLFMRRVRDDGDWSLMCPDECPGLTDAHGAAFDNLYEQYEREGRRKRVVPARKLWRAILDAQVETGTPYMLYKDACNRKSNQQHLGPIKCSNLCCEIVEFAGAAPARGLFASAAAAGARDLRAAPPRPGRGIVGGAAAGARDRRGRRGRVDRAAAAAEGRGSWRRRGRDAGSSEAPRPGGSRRRRGPAGSSAQGIARGSRRPGRDRTVFEQAATRSRSATSRASCCRGS